MEKILEVEKVVNILLENGDAITIESVEDADALIIALQKAKKLLTDNGEAAADNKTIPDNEERKAEEAIKELRSEVEKMIHSLGFGLR